jgi:large subunit ribosomal protein L37Ae|tara:strand:+ start:6064 stop:6435 length:372 start_codon:yes stop_codon:yes gene_type:complete
MVKTKVEKLGSAKRFGARYGSKPKHKFAKIETEQRKKHRCPYCNHLKVKRIAAGIWHCRKCNSKFTGKAYSVAKLVGVEETPAEDRVSAEEKKNVDKTEELERLPKANLEERQKPFDKTEEVL